MSKHRQFINDIQKIKQTQKTKSLYLLEQEMKRQEIKSKSKEKSEEKHKVESIQEKKQRIKDSLKTMRENHEKFIMAQQESRLIFNQVRKKKKLH